MRNGVGSWLSVIGFVSMLAALAATAQEAPATETPPDAVPEQNAPQDGGFKERVGEVQEEAAPPTEREEYIILDVKDKDLREVLGAISRKVGINIVADKQVDEKVTV